MRPSTALLGAVACLASAAAGSGADLDSTDATVRMTALEALATQVQTGGAGQTLPAAADARRALLDPLRPQLVRATTDRNDGIRALSGFLLSWVTPDAPTIDALLVLADDPVPDVQAMGRQGLMTIGKGSPKAQAKVLASLDPSSREGFAWAAATAQLWEATEAIPNIVRGLDSRDVQIATAAARALAGFGPGTRESHPALRAARDRTPTDDPDHRDLRDLLDHAIHQIETAPKVEGLSLR
jgi:hypothetical protein